MAKEQSSVADIFRRAQAVRRESPRMSYKDLKARLVEEYAGAPFPPLYNVAIPEQDARAPEEDWSAGLSLVRRGIQMESWKEIVSGIVLSLEQTEGYESQRGTPGQADEWHDRSVGIKGQVEKGVSKWMPEELMRLAERSSKK